MNHLFHRADRDAGRWSEIVSSADWNLALRPFPQSIRHHAANLAGHSWDIVVDGERLLVCCSWSGGHWINTAGVMTPLTDAEVDQLYPPIPQPPGDNGNWYKGQPQEERDAWTRYRNGDRQYNRVPRQKELVLP